jgi:hypothetical protein
MVCAKPPLADSLRLDAPIRRSRRGRHTTDSEVARYTKAADQRTLSDTAGQKLLANLAEKLANSQAK